MADCFDLHACHHCPQCPITLTLSCPSPWKYTARIPLPQSTDLTDTMADIFPKQSVLGTKFFSGVAENANFLGCYAMYGPSGMTVEVIPEDDDSLFLQKTNNK